MRGRFFVPVGLGLWFLLATGLLGCNMTVLLSGGSFPKARGDIPGNEDDAGADEVPDDAGNQAPEISFSFDEPPSGESIPEELGEAPPEKLVLDRPPIVLTPDRLLLRLKLKEAAFGLTTDGTSILYCTKKGKVYQLDPKTNTTKQILNLKVELTTSLVLLNGLLYVGNTGEAKLHVYTYPGLKEVEVLEGVAGFPDGMGHLKGKLYVVDNDDSNIILEVQPKTGKVLRRIRTGVADPVAISGHKNYLYIVEESGDIYKVDPRNGASAVVYKNPFKQSPDEFLGFEGMVILNGIVWAARVDDATIYTIRGALR